MLTGLFANNIDAEKTYHYLIEKGYNRKNINLIMSEATRINYFLNNSQGTEIESDTIANAQEGAAIGGSIGMTTGTIAGIALAVGSNVIIPGLGFLIAGPIRAGLVGAGTGAIAGALIRALMVVGFGEDRDQLYEAHLESGQILIGIHPNTSDEEVIKLAWGTMGGTEISS